MNERSQVSNQDQQAQTDQIEQAVQAMSNGKGDQILQDFEAFRSYLAKRIEMAQGLGFGDEQLAVIAQKVAGYLAEHEEPRNSEEYLLRELWKVGTEAEQHKLAHMLVKLAQSAH
ncbi:DUF3243 domain-containing protein [Paenibacillus sacheonensis]|uniref:DUF3243 family protein n=1 Tax=Paenibacillus sacheonensis TaxID=742054 RepID=A0A7X5C034_9BACL|nr:DUF3243 domain-containing protein [Paenibacillus sacheonensis]MBM7567570.1 ABC-type amino acid transport substrate-binding protein [Paenibacillus sacheonensis]NBC71327.1 DUF3243 family protein [Paenibacillus sacheonensis]